MIPLIVTITEFRKDTNDCVAVLENGKKIILDPFVSCAIPQTEEDYESDKGFELVGQTYCMHEYSVYQNTVTPHKGGLLLVANYNRDRVPF